MGLCSSTPDKDMNDGCVLPELSVPSLDANAPTTLLSACQNRQKSLALSLLRRKTCDLNIQDEKGNLALHLACANRMKTVALEILKQTKSGEDTQNIQGLTPLMLCCALPGMLEVAEEILNLKQECPGAIDKQKNTAFMYACGYGKQSLALRMLEMPIINSGQINVKKITALMLACKYQLETVVKTILRKNCPSFGADYVNPLHASALSISVINFPCMVPSCIPRMLCKRCPRSIESLNLYKPKCHEYFYQNTCPFCKDHPGLGVSHKQRPKPSHYGGGGGISTGLYAAAICH